ncbi:hypothetical protein [Roseicitreum antarcticum]|uniref:DUF3108 domain-containing protein n=1 Tax=Roseicitreum antarcticum TaxID=564137 RepID=A0A1H3EZA1_9RHOB|nr:hypothetical protein [Roseicitreum antarcticum]SDX84126.1 hypothetical protein SAMN04488238_1292 [Roseicitreum antarcticum]
MIRSIVTVALSTSLATAAAAETALTAVPPPPDRPYPYEILGLQPGDPLADVTAVFDERSGEAPTSESQTVRVQSSDGAVVEFSYDVFTRIGDIGVSGRMAKAPEDMVTATLTTGVMEQRPMAIYRSIRQPSDQLPEPLALRAQIEETYGPPSRVEITDRTMTLTYAWATDIGFIPDLDALPEQTITEELSPGVTRGASFRTCDDSRVYDNDVTYRFHDPRDKDIKPGCLATFTVTYQGDPGLTSIGFALVDFELGRMHRQELDRQIIEALTGEDVTPSDMDL